jgi:hypothetical protein
MAQLITLSINLSKLESARFTTKKGTECLLIPLNQKGIFCSEKTKDVYLNTNIEVKDEEDQYGNDVTCFVSQSKEERDAKEKRIYLANGRVVWSGESKPKTEQSKPQERFDAPTVRDEDDDLPF